MQHVTQNARRETPEFDTEGASAQTCRLAAVVWPNVQGNRRADETLAKLKACAGASG